MFAVYELLDLLPNGFVPSFTPRLNDLCTFLMTHDQMSEKDAVVKYFGTTTRAKYFNNLKNDLKRHLTRYLIAYPSWIENEHKALYEECFRHYATYKIMLLSNKRKAGIDLAQNLLPNLLKCDLHSMAHIVANDLLTHYSTIDSTSTLAKKYEDLATRELGIVYAESIVRKYNARVFLIANKRESFTPAMIEEFKEAVRITEPFLNLGVHFINRLIYTIIIARYRAVYDYKNIITYCDDALASFPKDHPNDRVLRFVFMYNKIPALTALGRLDEAKQMAKDANKLVTTGHFNWHVVLLKRIGVCLHGGDYQEAYELYKAHSKQPCDSYPILNEYWKIIHGYLYFLVKQEYIEPYTDERFYLGKFLNVVPIYSKDKAGNNINILIIQIITRMQREQYGHIIDRVDSLREYARVYTKNPETKRANIFISMILKMESAHFHRIRTETKTEKLFERLQNTPLKIGQNLTVEIIPYDILWKEMLSMLANKFRGKTVKRTLRHSQSSKKNKP